jgi:hypothetical protein
MDFLILIKNGCDNLTATVSPSIDSLGLRMVIALATIMLVWFGVQEALASGQGGPGFSIPKFISFFVLITFAYCSSSSTTAPFQVLGIRSRGLSVGERAASLITSEMTQRKRYRTRFIQLWGR